MDEPAKNGRFPWTLTNCPSGSVRPTVEAKSLLEGLLLDDPENANAWVNLARVYALDGEHASAEGAFEKALELDPANVEARWQQAKRAMHTGDVAVAERLIREIRMIQGAAGH